MVGRKPPLYAGLALFTLASIGCALATDIQTLVALRFLQGLGAAAMGIVGLFANGRPLPMVVGMASGALIALALTWVTLRGPVHATPVERLKG